LRTTYFVEPQQRNYVMQWNLNVQYQLYVERGGHGCLRGSRARAPTLRVDDADQVLPTKTSAAGYLWPQVDADGNPY